METLTIDSRKHIFPRIVAATVSIILGAWMRVSMAESLPPTNPATITVRLESKPEPKKAIGLVLSKGSTLEIPDAKIDKIGEKLYNISFVVERGMIKNDSVATAMAFDENGEATYANVSPEVLSETSSLVANIPDCPAEGSSSSLKPDQVGPLQQLVEVRSERVEIARLKISRLLDQSFSEKLKKFEDAFGLQSEEELNAALPPEVLVDRLSRISHALKKYKMFQKSPRGPNE